MSEISTGGALEPSDPAYQHTVLYRRQGETRCGKAAPDRRGMTPPAITQLPKCAACYPLQVVRPRSA